MQDTRERPDFITAVVLVKARTTAEFSIQNVNIGVITRLDRAIQYSRGSRY
ncbi:hypothetical protein [Bradyrhizobium mercantei]|uniref:hypothetical protein n=1 Tax=Bradyrhizobium mercantei TaxID=1904807 RepID=UPI00135662FF|nr:hypothetical protein [Bradyrhizobium mercantei]